jgi:lysophospholipase L1-like esterase
VKTKAKIFLFQILFLTTACAIIEIFLRVSGYAPGDLKPNWLNFHPVDSLYVVNDYYANKEGVLIADSLYWAAQNVHVNEDGFRSPNFSTLNSSKKKILFIGDSFTWGLSASPVTNHCFVDLIRNETNYEVVNLGIPAADPPQYLSLAEKYIPKLKPDLMFVVFFMGNDLMKEDRKIIPGEPFYYYTNAGAILADIDGRHFKNAREAYNYILNDKYYLHQPKNIFEKIISKSSLLSRLYSVRFRIEEKWQYEKMLRHTELTKSYLKKIISVAQQSNVPVKLILIPEVKEADMCVAAYTKKYADILMDEQLKGYWLFPQNKKEFFKDYPDAHLNNNGHRLYADFLKAFLVDSFEHE